MALKLGQGTRVESTAKLMHDGGRDIEIGDHVRLMRGTEILGPVTIADNVFINRDVYIRPNTTIGARVAIGPFVRIISDTHDIGPSEHRAGRLHYDPISIGAGTWIGAAATILAGVSIGEGCVVAAGSIVTKDVPPNTVVAGVPARVIRELPLNAPDDGPVPMGTTEDNGSQLR